MKYISLILNSNFNKFHTIVFDIISVLDLIRYENSTSSLIAFTYHMLNINVTYCIFDDLFNLMQQNHHNITQQRSTQLTPTKLDFSFFPEETLIQTEIVKNIVIDSTPVLLVYVSIYVSTNALCCYVRLIVRHRCLFCLLCLLLLFFFLLPLALFVFIFAKFCTFIFRL